MGKITAVEKQKKNKDRVNVFVDGEFFCGLEYIIALKYAIRVGEEFEPARLIEIQKESDAEKAFGKAVDYICKKPRTEKEITDYLINKGYDAQIIDGIVAKLKHYGYINDDAYVKAYIDCYGKREGRAKIAFELSKKGIKDDANDRLKEFDENAGADNCLDKFLRTHKTVDKAKLYRYMSYRGFSFDTISNAIKRRDDICFYQEE